MLKAPHPEDLPPVELVAVKQPPAAQFEQIVYPSIAIRLPRELVDAENLRSRAMTPLFVNISAGESQIDDEVPPDLAPRTIRRNIFGMEKEDLHKPRSKSRTLSPSI